MTDPFAALQSRLAVVAVLERIRTRAARGRELKKWGLNPQQVDPDSSLAADDAGFLTTIGGDYVRTTALYPIMSATDCLAAIAELVDGWDASNNSHMVSLLTLCRSAVETAAKTVWLLSETDRAGRRARSVGFTYSEMSNQKSFHSVEKRSFAARPGGTDSQHYDKLQEHIRLFQLREQILARERKGKTPNESGYVTCAAKWVDKHPPAHAEESPSGSFELGAERFYSLGSAFTHGYKWASDYVKGPQNAYGMVADGVAAAVAMANCAVALYEAQAQRRESLTDRVRHYPDRLEPTVRAWSLLFA
jgi:hypothetical protein